MNRYHWTLIGIGVIAFAWWTFFAGVSDRSAENDVYSQDLFLEDMGKIYTDIGHAAARRGDLTKAIKLYQETVAMRPTWLEAYDRLGIAYELNNQPLQAVQLYAQAMTINSDFIEYRQQLRRRTKQQPRTTLANFVRGVEWAGQDLTDKKILVYAEKGLSETLMFCRFLPLLCSKAAKVYFKPQDALVGLMRNAKFGVTLCNTQTNLMELDIDYYVSLLSVQHYLNLPLEQLNMHAAYLTAPQDAVTQLRKSVFNTPLLKVGIAWDSNVYVPGVKDGLVTPQFFDFLTAVPGIKLYALQKSRSQAHASLTPHGKINDISAELPTLAETAAAIENLDVFITGDMTLATLAGALHKKTWFLIPSINDWRWLSHWDKNHTIWFDHFRKINQPQSKDWQAEQALIAAKVNELIIKHQNK
jgi:tetratricopeptide (TPR) repeat protein